MSTVRNVTNEATPGNTAAARSDTKAQGTGGPMIVGIRLSVDPRTDKFVFSQDPSGAPESQDPSGTPEVAGGGEAASATPPDSTAPTKPKPSADHEAGPSRRDMARSPGTDIGGVAGRQLRLRPLPWIKVSLIAAVLCVAVVGWRLYGGNVSSYVETAPVLAARSDNSLEVRELQQQSATYQQQLAEERARGKDLEQQLAARQGDQEALSQERARTKALELQRAARQADQEPLAQERARAEALEQELAAARQSGQEAVAQARARSTELEQQRAGRQSDQEALSQERARTKALELQVAPRQADQEALAQERAHTKTLERGLVAARQSGQEAVARERARNTELEQQLAGRQSDQEALSQERARTQELERQVAAQKADREAVAQERDRTKALELKLAARQADQEALAQERARTKTLEQDLAAARRSGQEALAQERANSKALEQRLAAARASDQQALARERARSNSLELQLATVNPVPPALDLNRPLQVSAPPASDNTGRLDPTARDAGPARTADQVATPALASNDRPDGGTAAAGSVRPPINPEAARLLARAKLLLEEGDVGAARIVLERAAESGSAPALFALAETYDPAVLSSWGTIGTQSDVRKAQQLYAEALAGGVQEAKGRLKQSP